LNSLRACTTGVRNIGVGFEASKAITTGQYNTAVGTYALAACSTSHGNTSLGYRAGDSITTGAYNTSIGYYSDPAGPESSGNFTLGDGNVSTLRCNDTSISSLSDERDKTDIIDSPYGLDFINTVQPRQFKWQTRDGNTKDNKTRLGFVAQELLVACDGNNDVLDLVMDENLEKLEAKQGNLLPILVKAIQELSAENKALLARIEALETPTA